MRPAFQKVAAHDFLNAISRYILLLLYFHPQSCHESLPSTSSDSMTLPPCIYIYSVGTRPLPLLSTKQQKGCGRYRVSLSPIPFLTYFLVFLACFTKFSMTPSNASLSPICSSVLCCQ